MFQAAVSGELHRAYIAQTSSVCFQRKIKRRYFKSAHNVKISPGCCFASVMCGLRVTEAQGSSDLPLWLSALPRKLVLKRIYSGNQPFVMSLLLPGL